MRAPLVFVALLAASGAALAQALPFDMTPELAAMPARERAEAPALRPAAPERARRHLLSLIEPRLVGEEAARSWSVYLTEAEARGATLDLAFSSSIFVAPEASRLRLSINGTAVVDAPIRAAEAPARISTALPPGVLRPGPNVFRLDARQRHRTDCSVASTYELWTDLDPAGAFLSWEDPDATRPRDLRDVLATGVDASGATRIAVLAPGAADPAVAAEAMRLAQVLAVAIGPADPVVSIHEALAPAFEDAALRVAFGDGPALAAALGQATTATEAGFVEAAGLGPVLAVGRHGVDAVAEALAPPAGATAVVRTAAWQLPDAPLAEGARRFDFAALGVPSQEFSGRRATIGFQVALPADFYAQGYGEAQLVLDGAYSGEVLPGSRIDVYVNGDLASTMPLGARGGSVLRSLPLEVTMRHFRPGVNTVRLETVLETEADAACAPGAAGTGAPRFAIFDTSRFDVPDFARLGQLPNLAATTARGFPYLRGDAPAPLVLGDGTDATRSAAATFLAKLAQASGAAIPVTLAPAEAPGGDAIFVGPVNRMPEAPLAAIALDGAARSDWNGLAVAGETAPVTPGAPLSLDGWRASVTRGTWLQPLNAAGAFLRENAPRLPWTAPGETPFAPGADTVLALAQAVAPDGGAWTVLTAPTPAMLEAGTAELARQGVWSGVGGRLSSLQKGSDVPFVLPATVTVAVETQPFTLGNARLIAANWMSGNIVAFSAALAAACLLLGLATRAMLANFGRRR